MAKTVHSGDRPHGPTGGNGSEHITLALAKHRARVGLCPPGHPIFAVESVTNSTSGQGLVAGKIVGTRTSVPCVEQVATARFSAQTINPTQKPPNPKLSKEKAIPRRQIEHTKNRNQDRLEGEIHSNSRDVQITGQVISLGKSPIKIKSLQQLLKSYPNERAARFLESGFTEGFCLNYTGPRMPVDLPNLKSAENNKDITQEKIRKEIKLGRYIGPFESRPLKNLRTNPIGLVPKKSPGD